MAYIPCRIGGGAIINIPNGKTVTPTDDIQTWLHCAGVFDNNYTTLAQILADTSVFTTLLADSNACDYMARSTSWALASGLVPTMTSNTTPSGTCFGSSKYDNNYDYYKAFDDGSGAWQSGNSQVTNQYIGYDFGTSVFVYCVAILGNDPSSGYANYSPKNFNVEYSDDNITWTTYDTNFQYQYVQGSTNLKRFYVQLNNPHRYYRIFIKDNWGATGGITIRDLQFYATADITTSQDAMALIGKYDYCSNALLGNSTWAEAIANSDYFEEVLNVKVPVMTGYTTPSGQVYAPNAATDATWAGWKAFDNDLSTRYSPRAANLIPDLLTYDFGFSVKIYLFKGRNAQAQVGSGTVWATKDFKIRSSDDNSTFEENGSGQMPQSNEEVSVVLNPANKRYWQFYCTSSWAAGTNQLMSVQELQFYGRQEPKAGVIHCATNDVITITGNGVTKTVYADGNEGVLPLDLKSGLYTFTSSIAKNPANLSENYSKNILITDYTTDVYLMPDPVKTLYWWGYEGNELEDCITANGWSSTMYTIVNPVHNSNDIYLNATSGTSFSAIAKSTAINNKTIKAIGKQTAGTTAGWLIVLRSSKSLNDAAVVIGGSVPSLNTVSLVTVQPQSSDCYLESGFGGGNRAGYLYALWYE